MKMMMMAICFAIGRDFFGIKPAVTAIVLHAAIRIGKRTLHNLALKSIAFCSFLAIFILNLSFPMIVLIAAVIGYFRREVVSLLGAFFSSFTGKHSRDSQLAWMIVLAIAFGSSSSSMTMAYPMMNVCLVSIR